MPGDRALYEWLEAAQYRGVKPGLERMERLLEALCNPEAGLNCLHVAGTNGKGSVCAFAESLLRASGHRTGFYSSPHLVSFSERFRIAGKPASEEMITGGIRRLRQACASWKEEELPTYFELVTALAFILFQQAACEVVILETGLGGRLDATNTAPKRACAITPIALDHTEWLGSTLTQIAREKAGIFRPGVPAFLAPQQEEAAEALLVAAAETGCPTFVIEEPIAAEIPLGLAGFHQRSNAALAIALVRGGGFSLDEEQIRTGLAEVDWPGRFQRLREGCLVLDGAHNAHAASQLVATWREEFGERKCRLIFGAMTDKDPRTLLAILSPLAVEVWMVPVASPRSFDPRSCVSDLPVPYRVFDNLGEALGLAFSPVRPRRGDREGSSGSDAEIPVLVAGSLFLVAEALALESGGTTSSRSQ